LNIIDANVIFRTSIIKGFFEPKLLDLDFKKSTINHPVIENYGLMKSDLLHIFFDLETGADYPDGDEWFIVEFLFPHDVKLPDTLKSSDYFTSLFVDKTKTYWHHRELIHFKYGKTKKLDDAFQFLELKYQELCKLLESL
tara:strand:- start:355 stop:774 length:420 start_codon:yes stop_codon:yes gene_type:complete